MATTDTTVQPDTCTHPGCTNRIRRKTLGLCERHARTHPPARPRADRNAVVATLDALQAAGFTLNALAKAAGCDPASLHRVYSKQATLTTDVYHRVAALTRTQPATAVPTVTWPSVRRVRALYAAGMTTREIADAASCDVKTIRELAADTRQYIHPATAARIDAAWRTHSARAVTKASGLVPRAHDGELCWAVPLAWDDIDDPTERHGAACP